MNSLSLNNNMSFKSASLNNNAKIDNRTNNTHVKNNALQSKDSVSFTSKNGLTSDLIKAGIEKLETKGQMVNGVKKLDLILDQGRKRSIHLAEKNGIYELSVYTNYTGGKYEITSNLLRYTAKFEKSAILKKFQLVKDSLNGGAYMNMNEVKLAEASTNKHKTKSYPVNMASPQEVIIDVLEQLRDLK